MNELFNKRIAIGKKNKKTLNTYNLFFFFPWSTQTYTHTLTYTKAGTHTRMHTHTSPQTHTHTRARACWMNEFCI